MLFSLAFHVLALIQNIVFALYKQRNVIPCLCLSLVLLTACGGGGGGGSSGGGGSGGNAPVDSDNDGVSDVNDVDIDNDGLIEINDLQQLDWMRHNVDGTARDDGAGNASDEGCPTTGCNGYELMSDLDFDTNGDSVIDTNDIYFDYDNDGSNNGWLPIPSYISNFDGNGHIIHNLFINRPLADAETNGRNIGLFASVSKERIEIRNLTLMAGSVIGHERVGGLAGSAGATSQSIYRNLHTDLSVSGSTEVGGLIGFTGVGVTIEESSTSGTVMGTGDYVGGILGWAAFSGIYDSEASGSVSSAGNYIGGLAGFGTPLTIRDSIARGDVSGTDYVGGIAGSLNGSTSAEVSNNQAHGDVIATNNYAGGLIGYIESNVSITQSQATGQVSGVDAVGGLVGSVNVILPSTITTNEATLEGNFSVSTVNASNNYVGGFIGISYHTQITANFSTGSVNGNRFVAGFIGDANAGSVLTANFSTGSVTGNNDVGGLVGYSDTAEYIDNYFATDTSGQADAIGTVFGVNNIGATTDATAATLAELQCPTAENNAACAAVSLYDNWGDYTDADSNSYWDFGTAIQLPGLNIDGTVFRDSNGDGTLD